jgi:Leu/Phe-tRNA-protein transferase
MKIIDPQFLFEMYTKGYFPMAKSEQSIEVEFFKPYKRFLIPISDFHIPKRFFREFKKKNIILN